MDGSTRPQGAALLHAALIAADAGARDPAALAAALGYDEAALGRALNGWAGIGPDAAAPWAQLLAPDLGRWLLAGRRAALDQALLAPAVAGVANSGGLRLPWHSHAPEEVAGLQVCYGWFDGPLGLMAVTGVAEGPRRGLCGLAFAGGGAPQQRAAALADLRDRWPRAGFVERPEALASWVAAALDGAGEVPLLLIGSALQLAVWRALLEIPSGQVASYSQLATRAGRPRAVRAVASAIGRNPLSWLVPCHRALRKSGALGGYYWGLPAKRALLAREVARLESPSRALAAA